MLKEEKKNHRFKVRNGPLGRSCQSFYGRKIVKYDKTDMLLRSACVTWLELADADFSVLLVAEYTFIKIEPGVQNGYFKWSKN
jgi:hypothetical protein